MYMVAIAWIFVALMMSITESSIVAGVLTFLLYGLAPLALFLWLMGTQARKRMAYKREMERLRLASANPDKAQQTEQ